MASDLRGRSFVHTCVMWPQRCRSDGFQRGGAERCPVGVLCPRTGPQQSWGCCDAVAEQKQNRSLTLMGLDMFEDL